MLNPRNTFDSFKSDENIFAYAAAEAIAKDPGKSYNPVLFCGEIGAGQRHLLHALGNHVLANKKSARVNCTTAEQFAAGFIDAVQKNNLVAFRKKCQQADLLLLDDIHYLIGKKRLQEEFFHIFRLLVENHCQVAMAGNFAPAEMEQLASRLVNRFDWGLVA